MAETLLTLIPEAAGHELLGGASAFYAGTATGAGLNSSVVCDDLTDPSGAQSYKGWRIYFHTSGGGVSIAGQERLVTSVDLATGTLTFAPNLARATTTGDGFWLLQTYRRSNWRDFANRAIRQLKRRIWVAVQGLGDSILRYETANLPSGLVRPEDVVEVGYRSYPAVNTEGKPALVRWYGWEDNDGTFSLLLSDGISTSRALVFYMEKPYVLPGAAAFTADADTTTAPADWLIGEMVEKALRDRWARATDADKPDWLRRLQAQILTNQGYRAKYLPTVGRRNMGFDPTF